MLGDSFPNTANEIANLCNRLHGLLKSAPRWRFPLELTTLPENGLYVLMEEGELGHETMRAVRVGTHTGKNQLRSRLAQHFIAENKDRSVFRKNIGRCLLSRTQDSFFAQWNIDLTTRNARQRHAGLLDETKRRQVEHDVSAFMRRMFSFVVMRVEDKATRLQLESRIASTVSLCSECKPSSNWLGLSSPNPKIRQSGLWQVNELYKTPLNEADLDTVERCLSSHRAL